MTTRRFYLVRPERYLHFPNFPKEHRVWARPGEYVETTHPMLMEWISDQLGKVQSVSVVPRGSVLIDEAKLPRGVASMMVQYERKGSAGTPAKAEGGPGLPTTTEDIYASDEARAEAGVPAPLSALAAPGTEATGSPLGGEESEEDGVEAASGVAGEAGGIPDVQPPK